jgi:hypothetical protein
VDALVTARAGEQADPAGDADVEREGVALAPAGDLQPDGAGAELEAE